MLMIEFFDQFQLTFIAYYCPYMILSDFTFSYFNTSVIHFSSSAYPHIFGVGFLINYQSSNTFSLLLRLSIAYVTI